MLLCSNCKALCILSFQIMCVNWKKAIYGLCQAPRAWYNELRTFILATGFSASRCDTSLFIRTSSSDTLYLLVYVDDIIITGSNDSLIQKFIASLSHRFSLKDLGSLHFFVGVEAPLAHPLAFISLNKNIFGICLSKLKWMRQSLLALQCRLLRFFSFMMVLLLVMLLNIGRSSAWFNTCHLPDQMFHLLLTSSHNTFINHLLLIGLLWNVFFVISKVLWTVACFSALTLP